MKIISRSYGKVGALFSLVPCLGFLVFSTKIIGLVPTEVFQRWFFAADWTKFAGDMEVTLKRYQIMTSKCN